MKQRCLDPKSQGYKHYGARGITICEEWYADFLVFEAWAKANGYKPGLQIDRIDPNKGYEPGNCRFVTISQNVRNQRRRRSNTSGYKGVSLNKRMGKWSATIRYDGKSHHLGFFEDPVIAAKVYDAEALKYHGEYALINFPAKL